MKNKLRAATYFAIGALSLIAAPLVANAVNVTVPQSTAYGQVLIGNAAGGSYTPVATSTLGITGGSGSPGGASSTIQYNANGAFAGNTGLVYTGTNVGIGSSTPWGQLSVNPTAANNGAPGLVVGSSTGTSLIVASTSYVGINTTIPLSQLDVHTNTPGAYGGFVVRQDSTTGIANFAILNSSNNDVSFFAGSPSQSFRNFNGLGTGARAEISTNGYQSFAIGNFTNTPLLFVNNNVERLRIDTGGNVGIASSSPTGTLSVAMSSTTIPFIVGVAGSSTPSFQIGSANNNGGVGIKATPRGDAPLVVGGTLVTGNGLRTSVDGNDTAYFENNLAYTQFHMNNTLGTTQAYVSINSNGSGNMGNGFNDTTAGAQFWTAGARRLTLGTNNQDRLTILPTGNSGFGTTTPYAKLSVFIGGASDAYAALAPTTAFAIGSTTQGTATTTLLSVLSNGRMGINTSAPLTALQVNGTIYANSIGNTELAFNSAGTNFVDFYDPNLSGSNGGIAIGGTAAVGNTPSTATMFWNVNNNLVGVGTTSPAATFAVHGNQYTSGTSFFGGAITATSTLAVSGLASFVNASTSLSSVTGTAYFGGTATTTINADGLGTIAVSNTTATSTLSHASATQLVIGTITGILTAVNGYVQQLALSAGLSYSGTTLSQVEHPSFTYATTTTWTGTTTIPLATAYGQVWNSLRCFTDAGTLGVDFSHSTNHLNYIPTASTTNNTFTLTTNNTMTDGDKVSVDIGTPASSPTKITCTVKDTY